MRVYIGRTGSHSCLSSVVINLLLHCSCLHFQQPAKNSSWMFLALWLIGMLLGCLSKALSKLAKIIFSPKKGGNLGCWEFLEQDHPFQNFQQIVKAPFQRKSLFHIKEQMNFGGIVWGVVLRWPHFTGMVKDWTIFKPHKRIFPFSLLLLIFS